MFNANLLAYLALVTTTLATPNFPGQCYRSTTTVPHPALSCTPFADVCPMVICVDQARPKATVTVPRNYEALVTQCGKVPTVTKYAGKCTTDCGPVTCPTLTVTKTGKRVEACCSGGYS